VFRSPVDDRELVKRVIGLPGDSISIQGNALYINGIIFADPWGASQTACNDGGECAWHVPEGEYFVLGDNREDSRDSREGWTVPIENIDGRKLLAY
jgi:signal peptidase I